MLPHVHQSEGVYSLIIPMDRAGGGDTCNNSTKGQRLIACHCAISPKSFTVNNWLLIEG